MAEVNLLKALPQSERDIKKREVGKNPEVIAESRKYGEMYFDGPREYGYGGYSYDGRWIPVARDIVSHFDLKPGMCVLDIGCAKGFLVKDLVAACPGLEVFGIDISDYAVTHCPEDVADRLQTGSADHLPFSDNHFDCVLAINVLHNLERPRVIRALQEINRVVRKPENSFVQVDAYRTLLEKEVFESWVLTALYYDKPEGWLQTFADADYKGDWYWTILKASGEMETS